MSRSIPALSILLIIGCTGDKADDTATVSSTTPTGSTSGNTSGSTSATETTTPGTTPATAGPSLSLALETSSAAAGESVGLALELVWEDGTRQDVVGAIDSDLEPGLIASPDTLIATIAGAHTLTASATHLGEALSATASLDITAGAVADVDLDLSDRAMTAGGALTAAVSAADAWGNAVAADAASLSVSDPAVTLTGDTLEGTIAGLYSVTATLDEVSDTEDFQINAGEAVTVDISLTDTDIEVYESVETAVSLTDLWGNEVDMDWTVTAPGTGTTTVSHTTVTFWDEGEYSVRVDVGGTSLWDEEGPFIIDSTGPDLEITTPERGDWMPGDTSGSTGTVSGTVSDEWSSLDSVTVDGAAMTVSSAGAFSTSTSWDFGFNTVETIATDTDGNETSDLRGLLVGNFLEYGERASSGMVVRINEGAGGFDELEVLGESLITASELEDAIPDPIYDESEEYCVWGYCYELYALTLTADNPAIGSVELELDPRPTGRLEATFTISDVSIDWDADGAVAGGGYSDSGTLTIDTLRVESHISFSVNSSNEIEATVDTVYVTTTGFDAGWDSWIETAMSYFGYNIDDELQSYLEDAVEDAVVDELPPALEDAFQDLDVEYTLTNGGSTYTITAAPEDIDIDDRGLTLEMESRFVVSGLSSASGEGSLYYGYGATDWSGSTGIALGVSADFINQIFYGLWADGLLDTSFTDAELDLDVSDLAAFIPGLTSLTFEVESLLPPVATVGTRGDLLDLDWGSVLVTLYNGSSSSGTVLVQAYIQVESGLDMSVDAGGQLQTSVSDAVAEFDVIVPAPGTTASADTEVLLEMLVPVLLPALGDMFVPVSLPDISGFTIENVTVAAGGDEDGFGVLTGELQAQ